MPPQPSKTITAANAVFTLAIPGVFLAAQNLNGFAADDIFTVEAQKLVETSMGVDGQFSGGFVFVPVPQKISFQANSPSIALFDLWAAAMVTGVDSFPAVGFVTLPSLGKKWSMVQGFLTSYPPMPDAGRTLKPQQYEVTWGQLVPTPL